MRRSVDNVAGRLDRSAAVVPHGGVHARILVSRQRLRAIPWTASPSPACPTSTGLPDATGSLEQTRSTGKQPTRRPTVAGAAALCNRGCAACDVASTSARLWRGDNDGSTLRGVGTTDEPALTPVHLRMTCSTRRPTTRPSRLGRRVCASARRRQAGASTCVMTSGLASPSTWIMPTAPFKSRPRL